VSPLPQARTASLFRLVVQGCADGADALTPGPRLLADMRREKDTALRALIETEGDTESRRQVSLPPSDASVSAANDSIPLPRS
jgi:hypothetical protein